MKMGGKRHTDLSNMSFASPSCLRHYFILCKHCHLVVTSAIIYLFILGVGGGGGCNNVSHLDIYNWVVFGMEQSLEIFKCSCLEYLTSEDKQRKCYPSLCQSSRAVRYNCSFYAVTIIFLKSSCFLRHLVCFVTQLLDNRGKTNSHLKVSLYFCLDTIAALVLRAFGHTNATCLSLRFRA